MENREGRTNEVIPQDFGQLSSLFDQDGLVLHTDRGYVAIVHAFDRSRTIRGLDIQTFIKSLGKGDRGVRFFWDPMEIRPLRNRESVFGTENGEPRTGLLSIMAYDLETVAEELPSVQRMLEMLGMRPLGPNPKDDIEYTYRKTKVHEESVIRRLGFDLGLEKAGIKAVGRLDRVKKTRETDARNKEFRIPGGATRSFLLVHALAQTFCDPEQPALALQHLKIIEALHEAGMGDPIGEQEKWDVERDHMQAEQIRATTVDHIRALADEVERANRPEYAGSTRRALEVKRTDLEAGEKARQQDFADLVEKIRHAADMIENGNGLRAMRLMEATGFMIEAGFTENVQWVGRALDGLKHGIWLEAIVDSPYRLLHRHQALDDPGNRGTGSSRLTEEGDESPKETASKEHRESTSLRIGFEAFSLEERLNTRNPSPADEPDAPGI